MEKMDRRVRKTRALLLQGLVKMMENHDIVNAPYPVPFLSFEKLR